MRCVRFFGGFSGLVINHGSVPLEQGGWVCVVGVCYMMVLVCTVHGEGCLFVWCCVYSGGGVGCFVSE